MLKNTTMRYLNALWISVKRFFKKRNAQHFRKSVFLHVLVRLLTIPCRKLDFVFNAASPFKLCRFTNITDGWVIDGAELKEQLNIPTLKLINDFAAMGYGLLTLRPEEYVTLNDVPRDPTAPVATIGAGTGLGECFLTPSGNGAYECYACEGGHADFAPTNELEVELLNYLKEKFHEKHRISMERIISGIGLSNVYEFLSQKYSFKVNKAIHTEWEEAGSLKGAVVGKYATSDELCRQAMEIFVRAYGREAGNAALKYLPRGGFYITGGLACKNLSFFTESPEFIESFFDKGRVSAALKHIPFYLVLTEELGERGAHFAAYQLLTQQQQSKSPLMTDRTRLYAATATAAAAFVAVSAAKLLSRR